MTLRVKKRKERNPRPLKEDIDLLGYDALINKVMVKLVKKHGKWVYRYQGELRQEGSIGLIKAHKVYDRTKGTFVTIAYLKVYTQMSRFLIKEARIFSKTNRLEELTLKMLTGRDSIDWQDLFPSHEISYEVVVRLGAKSKLDKEIIYHLIKGTYRRNIPAKVGLTDEQFEVELSRIKDNLVAVCYELYQTDLANTKGSNI